MKKLMLVCGLVCMIAAGAQGQILLSSGLTYTQNFDTLGGSGGNPSWTDNTTLRGWYASRATTTSGGPVGSYPWTSYRSDGGLQNSGWIYSYGVTNPPSSDRALGTIASGTTSNVAFGLRIQNDTADQVQLDGIGFWYEQWRNGGNVNVQTNIYFSYRTSSSAITDPDPAGIYATWTRVLALDSVTPTTGSTASPLDGNASANRVYYTNTFTGITLNAGDEIFLRWFDINDAGNDHGGGIDNFTVVFSIVPEPASAILIGLGVLGLVFWRRRK